MEDLRIDFLTDRVTDWLIQQRLNIQSVTREENLKGIF